MSRFDPCLVIGRSCWCITSTLQLRSECRFLPAAAAGVQTALLGVQCSCHASAVGGEQAMPPGPMLELPRLEALGPAPLPWRNVPPKTPAMPRFLEAFVAPQADQGCGIDVVAPGHCPTEPCLPRSRTAMLMDPEEPDLSESLTRSRTAMLLDPSVPDPDDERSPSAAEGCDGESRSRTQPRSLLRILRRAALECVRE